MQLIFTNAMSQDIWVMEEGKTYVSSPAGAPKGASVKKGPRGGYYYEEPAKGMGPASSGKRARPKGKVSIPAPSYHKPKLNVPTTEDAVEDVLDEFSETPSTYSQDIRAWLGRNYPEFSQEKQDEIIDAYWDKHDKESAKGGPLLGAKHAQVDSKVRDLVKQGKVTPGEYDKYYKPKSEPKEEPYVPPKPGERSSELDSMIRKMDDIGMDRDNIAKKYGIEPGRVDVVLGYTKSGKK